MGTMNWGLDGAAAGGNMLRFFFIILEYHVFLFEEKGHGVRRQKNRRGAKW